MGKAARLYDLDRGGRTSSIAGIPVKFIGIGPSSRLTLKKSKGSRFRNSEEKISRFYRQFLISIGSAQLRELRHVSVNSLLAEAWVYTH